MPVEDPGEADDHGQRDRLGRHRNQRLLLRHRVLRQQGGPGGPLLHCEVRHEPEAVLVGPHVEGPSEEVDVAAELLEVGSDHDARAEREGEHGQDRRPA